MDDGQAYALPGQLGLFICLKKDKNLPSLASLASLASRASPVSRASWASRASLASLICKVWLV